MTGFKTYYYYRTYKMLEDCMLRFDEQSKTLEKDIALNEIQKQMKKAMKEFKAIIEMYQIG